MKKLLLAALFVLPSIVLLSQEKSNSGIEVDKFRLGNGFNVEFYGEASMAVADSLFAHFNIETKKPIKNIRNVKIDGLDEPITMEVHRGYRGETGKRHNGKSTCGGGSYTHTFTGKQNIEWFVANRNSNETFAVRVYFKRGRHYGVKSNQEYEIITKFLTSLYSL